MVFFLKNCHKIYSGLLKESLLWFIEQRLLMIYEFHRQILEALSGTVMGRSALGDKAYMKNNIIKLLLLLIMSLLFTGCAEIRHTAAMFRSTNHFIPHKNDSRVLYESQAKNFAELVLPAVSESISKVEAGHYKSFVSDVRIYVCETEKSFYKLYGAKSTAGVSNKLFLSPRLMKRQEHIEKYLTHELSHLHLYQQIGLFSLKRLPFWFKEGLAAFISDGGGAHTVSELEAINSIKIGKHFVPDLHSSLFSQKGASNWKLSHHMMYRQSMMFIAFLKSTDKQGFRNLLLNVQNDNEFQNAFEQSFDKSLDVLWQNFLFTIKQKG